MKPQPRLSLESFESREVPAALFATTWSNAGALTLSFAPDETAIAGYSQDALGAGQPSRLHTEMAGAGSAAEWQKEVLRAFQAWAVQTNINIGLVPDGGSPFGSTAAPSGQLRVGALAAGADVVAINQAANLLGGAWAGALLFNTQKDFSIGAQAGRFDIFSATLNEAGNIFGLADSADVASALYGHYAGVRAGLTAADVAAIRTLYGTRTADAFETAAAYRLNPHAAPADATKTMVSASGADLTTLADVDEYVFTTGAATTTLTVRLETVGKSLLAAKVSVFDGSGALVGTASSVGPLATQDLTLTVTGVAADTDYVVRVEKVTDDVFGVGRYDLSVGYNFAPTATAAADGPTFVSDGGTNDTTATATVVAAVAGSASGRYTAHGRVEAAGDADVYQVTAPATTNAPLTVTVDPRAASALYSRVTVYAANGSVVPHTVLASGADGRVVVQVSNPTAGAAYFVQVEGVGRSGTGVTGDYTVSADFTHAAVALSTVASGTLTAAASNTFRTFTVAEAKLMHFALDAATTSSVACGVRLIVYNAAGGIVATLTANAGSTSTGLVFLNTGTYYLKIEAAAVAGQTLPTVSYALRTAVLSDPVDPYMPLDPTEPPPPPPPDYEVKEETRPIYDNLPPDPWANPWHP